MLRGVLLFADGAEQVQKENFDSEMKSSASEIAAKDR
jgi:hypothetical protein